MKYIPYKNLLARYQAIQSFDETEYYVEGELCQEYVMFAEKGL